MAKATPSTTLAVRILKIGKCSTLSGKGKLTYQVGCTTESDIQFRVISNSGGGFFSTEWVPLKAIQDVFAKVPDGKAITSFLLYQLFSGRSLNTPAFLLSALLTEGLVEPHPKKKRSFACTDGKAFFAEVKGLIASGVALKVEEPAKRSAKTVEAKATTVAKPEKSAKVAKAEKPAKVVDMATVDVPVVPSKPKPITEKPKRMAAGKGKAVKASPQSSLEL